MSQPGVGAEAPPPTDSDMSVVMAPFGPSTRDQVEGGGRRPADGHLRMLGNEREDQDRAD